ncbi:MAG: matrixin family metalloprotease, partial [Sedimentisphaerales bacterium]|nr:matrixin family metalloprotease [Sedimentisphaerales bacterium]
DSNINFVYGGLTAAETAANPVRDNLNTVSFKPLNSAYPNAIGITFYWYSRANKQIVEADTVFNSDLPWSINSYGAVFNGSYDLRNIATHEFGHWLVLGDLYSGRDAELTMYGYGAMGETKKDTLGRGDISGIQKAY